MERHDNLWQGAPVLDHVPHLLEANVLARSPLGLASMVLTVENLQVFGIYHLPVAVLPSARAFSSGGSGRAAPSRGAEYQDVSHRAAKPLTEGYPDCDETGLGPNVIVKALPRAVSHYFGKAARNERDPRAEAVVQAINKYINLRGGLPLHTRDGDCHAVPPVLGKLGLGRLVGSLLHRVPALSATFIISEDHQVEESPLFCSFTFGGHCTNGKATVAEHPARGLAAAGLDT
mmetsp:Transcript_32777/g.79739  ORF Transcript_32777/g.79739 Transcript_32777/m.79739 type:complete len:232 (+) Transcript_32777:2400-3095(+)